MALPSSEVIAEFNKLIKAATGFEENSENFANCKKYCLSHFVHHSYPSVNKTNVRLAIDGFATRFNTHGYGDVAEALKSQTELFLSYQDIFRVNPECDIEWNLLSLVCSLASNLNEVKLVPPLLSIEDDIEEKEDFDWGAYLKSDLPPTQHYSYDSDSDSLSTSSSTTISSTSHQESDIRNSIGPTDHTEDKELSIISHPVPIEWTPTPTPPYWRGQYVRLKELRRSELSVEGNISKFGNFACQWYELCKRHGKKAGKPTIVSEKLAVETILHSLLTGNPFCLNEHSVCLLAKDTFQDCLHSLEPYVAAVAGLRQFIESKSQSSTVIMKAYISSLKRSLNMYELNILDINEEELPFMKTLESIRPELFFLRSLQSVHRQCVAFLHNEPAWKSSLRILIVLYVTMINCTTEELKALYFAMFMTCFAHFADVLDSLITKSSSSTSLDDFVIVRDKSMLPSLLFRIHPYHQLFEEFNVTALPFFEPVVEKVLHADTSLSIIYHLDQFSTLRASIKGLPTLREVLVETVETAVGKVEGEDIEDDDLDICGDLARFLFEGPAESLGSNGKRKNLVDFFEITRNTKSFHFLSRIHKDVENKFLEAFTMRIDRVRFLARKILFEDHKLERHLTVLRNVLLFNNVSQLLPFTQVFVSAHDSEKSKRYGYHLFLSSLLRTCVEVDFPELASKIFVEVTDDCDFLDIFEAIDHTVIRFDVPYPVSLVLTPVALEKYNDIFRSLLKLKYVHSMLSHLPFLEKEMDVIPEVMPIVQRLQIQRFTCFTELVLIMNYFMAQVTTPLHSPMEDYQDVQDIIKDHAIRLEQMHFRCMLSPEDLNYKVIFDNLLPMFLELQKCWSLQGSKPVQNLKSLEQRHETYQFILQLIMQNLESEVYEPRHPMFLNLL